MINSPFKRILRSMYMEDARISTISMLGLVAVSALMLMMIGGNT